MSVDVIMPKLGESITEGTILEWKKNVGDTINKDETLLEISTDKVDSEIPSPAEGKLLEILYKVNDVVAVGTIIARIGSESGDVLEPSNHEKPLVEDEEENINVVEDSYHENNTSNHTKYKSTSRFYSPLVKSIANKENISLNELDQINGTGNNGRVNKKDILDYIKNRNHNQSSFTNLSEDKGFENVLENRLEPMGHVRKMIAQHMAKSRDTSVHVYSTSEVDMTNIVEYRNNSKEKFKSQYQTPLTYTPFIIDAVIKAIHDFPLINAKINNENIQFNQNINIGVAVALADDNLIVPVIKRSEELNFLGLARATNDLASRARGGKLNPDEAQGSTFTVTNPGIFGSLFGMGIINQPNVGLLSVGAINKKPVVKETEYGDVVVVRSMMYLTLAYDHRIIDGSYGTRFLSRLKQLLESFSKEKK
tara:strand:- start:751 stop:2019 length:1269 start_codon:yes stop_codon:yes gene_type:complete